jgi:hypothetical protein
MTEKEIYTGSFGFPITFETGQDLSESLSFRLRIRKPNENNIDIKLGEEAIKLPKKDGVIVYQTQKGDFTLPGVYKLQLFDETDNSRKSLTPVIRYKVKASLDFVER